MLHVLGRLVCMLMVMCWAIQERYRRYKRLLHTTFKKVIFMWEFRIQITNRGLWHWLFKMCLAVDAVVVSLSRHGTHSKLTIHTSTVLEKLNLWLGSRHTLGGRMVLLPSRVHRAFHAHWQENKTMFIVTLQYFIKACPHLRTSGLNAYDKLLTALLFL